MELENFIEEYKDCTVGQFLSFLKDDTRVILRDKGSMNSSLPMKAKYLILRGKLLDNTVDDISVCKDVIGYTAIVVSYISKKEMK